MSTPDLAVYKYPVPIDDGFNGITLNLPKGAEILSLQVQRGEPCLWALVRTDLSEHPVEERRFCYVGTGHKHPPSFWKGLEYVGTVMIEGGALVFHLFERTR